MVSAPELAMDTKMDCMPTDFITSIQVEPVGKWFLAHWNRLHQHKNNSLTGQESDSPSESEDENEEDVIFEDDLDYLRSLDPKLYKEQDHYKVLGIDKIRVKATDDQIKRAYRLKVLRHHPDKRRAAGEEIREDDDYFTCITKASEILMNPTRRRAYDSVDSTFDDDVPDSKKVTPAEFFQSFGPAFERNSRWSTRTPVPKLGDENASREQVDKFYKFWYDFESWREYSYLDEEDKEKGSDREERRWIEKNNRVQRAERKKDEMKRMRKLVDNAYACDPRVQRFLEDDRRAKQEKKMAKQEAGRARREEEERQRKMEEDTKREEAAKKEAEEKAKAEAAKKDREEKKRAIKKEKKTFRTLCKDKDFFATDEDDRLRNMTELDKLCEVLTVEELEEINAKLEKAKGDEGRNLFLSTVASVNAKLDAEKMRMVEQSHKSTGEKAGSTGAEWSSDELALLIKAVNLFPAGTNQRWEVVASFINQHSKTPEVPRSAKETLNKAKSLQQSDFHSNTLREDANRKAYENLERGKKRDVRVETEASTRTETAAELQGVNPEPWSTDEQRMLEQALKTYPASLGADRWESIADCLPNRSKKDCMRRYKELAEVVRAKKAAVAAAAAKSTK